MEVQTFFLILLIILLTARVCGELAARLQAPPVIGELFAGILLGPSLLGLIEPTEIIRLLAEIGIILLLFEVGLETDLSRLVKSGLKSVVVATSGAVLPLVLGYAISYYLFQQDFLTSLFIGGTLTATSIGITVRILTDLNRHQSHEASIVLGAAVIDDIVGVVLLAFLYEFSTGGGVNIANTGRVVLFIALFMLLAPILAKIIGELIKRFESSSKIPGLIPTTVVSLVLFFAWLAHMVGAPELLGGFVAGLAFSWRFFLPLGVAMRTSTNGDFAHRVDVQMKPIIHLFTPIFFVTVGLSLNFKAIDWSSPFIWTFSLSLFALSIASKLIGPLLIKENSSTRLVVGLAMVPRGEVGLIFAELGRASGIFTNETYAAIVIVIALTTLLPPFALKWFYGKYGDRMPAIEKIPAD